MIRCNAMGLTGGNMEGKEVRFGIANSALLAVITTAASYGAVNSMHDSYHAARRHDPADRYCARRDHLSAASARASTACCCSSFWPCSLPA